MPDTTNHDGLADSPGNEGITMATADDGFTNPPSDDSIATDDSTAREDAGGQDDTANQDDHAGHWHDYATSPPQIEGVGRCAGCLQDWVLRHIVLPSAPAKRVGECPICRDPYDAQGTSHGETFYDHIAVQIENVPTCASHVMGLKCLIQWFVSRNDSHNSCPICRGKLYWCHEQDDDEDEQGDDQEIDGGGK
jgi:hypothetical protein